MIMFCATFTVEFPTLVEPLTIQYCGSKLYEYLVDAGERESDAPLAGSPGCS
jgi:hypothetical protein